MHALYAGARTQVSLRMLLVLRINLQEAVSESDAVTKRPVHVEFTKDRPSSASRYSLLGSLSVHDAYRRRLPGSVLQCILELTSKTRWTYGNVHRVR